MTTALQCDYDWPDDDHRCRQMPLAHVHQPTPCVNGQDERHHEFRPEPRAAAREYARLLDELETAAPYLSRRRRVALRKALLR